MDKEIKEKIINILKERGAKLPCPRCGKEKFTLVDGYLNTIIQPKLDKGIIIGGPTVPSIVVICTNCGYISHHAIGALGLLPAEESKEEEKNVEQ